MFRSCRLACALGCVVAGIGIVLAAVPNPLGDAGMLPVTRLAGNPATGDPADDRDPAFNLQQWISAAAPVTSLVAYRWSSGVWTKVPFQVDERQITHICTYYDPVAHGLFDCDGGTQTLDSCELGYVWPGETDSDGPGVLDADDEVSFMAFEAGDQALTGNNPPGVLSDRYEFRLSTGGLTGYLYLYRTSDGSSAYTEADHYLTVTSEQRPFRGDCKGTAGCPGTNPDPVLDNWTTWEGKFDHPSLTGFATYKLAQQSNWTWRDLWVRPPGHSTWSDRLDILDTRMWRAAGETEHHWNQTSDRMGLLTGPVRSIRASVGAASGTGTTHYIKVYPTYLESEIHLRVHPISRIATFFDFLSQAGGAGSSVVREPSTTVDDVDGLDVKAVGADPPPIAGSTAGDYAQVNLPAAGTQLAMVNFDMSFHQLMCLHYVNGVPSGSPFPPPIANLIYRDDKKVDQTTPVTGIVNGAKRPLEEQVGAYGNIGAAWDCGARSFTVDSYDVTCSDRKYHGSTTAFTFSTSSSGTALAQKLDTYVQVSPIQVLATYQP